jgi:deoxyribodipyrimidine photo-lyase
MSAPVIVWFRHDLRIADHPALAAAEASGAPIVALFILDEGAAGEWRLGGASRWWLHHSLSSLRADLADLGVSLILRRGSADCVLQGVIAETSAPAVYWNRIYEPWAVRRDGAIKAGLRAQGVRIETFNASLLFEPSQIRTRDGGTYRMFTPFWRACLAASPPAAPLPAPGELKAAGPIASERLDDWRLLPTKPDWAQGLRETWSPGETSAHRRLTEFLHSGAQDYRERRDLPAQEQGVSRLSPHLRWGEISPRQIWSAVAPVIGAGAEAFLRQIIWREFSHHLLFANPHMPERPLEAKFDAFPWAPDDAAFVAWTQGRTGYPMVDAAMRQLWRIGYMHNRARLIAGSFLVKDLLLPWRSGERWFWDTLVDADLANNAMGWQWVAGCGADAAPYFRVFNPVLQGEKFDPEGAYVRRYVPELKALDAQYIHAPWQAPAAALREAGVRLGETYPVPIVDHKKARARALEAYASIKGA